MFYDISPAILDRMHYLEAIDAQDRSDGTTRQQRLRQITAETRKFIALLAANGPLGSFIEIGTSAGYSALWLSLACRATGRNLTTFEILADKAALAEETFRVTGVADVVTLVCADALAHLSACHDIAFCFLDAEKEVYGECYEAIIPNMKSGGILVADNAINHAVTLQPMLDRALSDPRVDAMIVPIGKGELLCRKR